jgi:formylglycine-generating enzyme
MSRPFATRQFLRVVLSAAVILGLTSMSGRDAAAVTIDLVTVGNAGNANDTTGYGGVAYDFKIAKYDVTIGQYAEFLNAVATTDTYGLYNANMGTDLNVAGISRSGAPGTYTYSSMSNGGASSNRPIANVSWFNAARFANWVANGQPTGLQTGTTTENGAYALNGATSGTAPAKNATNPNTGLVPSSYIPLENEWYKAAYYSPTLNSGSGGYFAYATQSNTAPGNVIGSGANQANYFNGVYSVTQLAGYSSSQNYLTDVGAFTNSASFYGTFDQSGNLNQWNDLDGTAGSTRGIRGGGWGGTSFYVSSSLRSTYDPSLVNNGFGFRLAAPIAVPEPSTCLMGIAGLACCGYLVRRKNAASQSRGA